jgi:hypothetical protein
VIYLVVFLKSESALPTPYARTKIAFGSANEDPHVLENTVRISLWLWTL